MHFSGNKSILGDSLPSTSYFPVPHSFRDQTCDVTITARSQRHSQYLSSAKPKGGTWPRCSGVPHFGQQFQGSVYHHSSCLLPAQMMLSVKYLISTLFYKPPTSFSSDSNLRMERTDICTRVCVWICVSNVWLLNAFLIKITNVWRSCINVSNDAYFLQRILFFNDITIY